MSMIRLELSNRDYNTIAEALLESALDWEHAADELGRLHQFCARTGDPAYGAKLARLDREQYRHRRLARRCSDAPKDSAILAQSLASRILLSSATISADSSADTVS